MSRSMILAVEVDAANDAVFEAVSTVDGLRGFWTADVEGDSEPGNELRFGFAAAPVPLAMTVAALEPRERIEWACAGPWPNWGGTSVEWLIHGSSPAMVVLRHFGWSDDQPDAEFGSVAHTWAMVLTSLKRFAETGQPAPALP